MNTGLFATKRILMDFDILVNTDIGMLYLIRDYFPNNKYINYDIFKNGTNRIITHLLNRHHENPLTLIFKDEYKDKIDDLYNELYNTYTKEILERSKLTDVINIVITASKFDNLHLNIYCKNQLEEQYIKDKLLQINCIVNMVIKNKITDLDFNNYDIMYVDKIKNLEDKIDECNLKPLYVTKAAYNLEPDEEERIVYIKYTKDRIAREFVNLVTPFIMDESFFIDNEINEEEEN